MNEELPNEVANIISESLDSVKLTKNAKGVHQWEIKCYREKNEPATTWLIRIKAIDKLLEDQYGDKE